MNVIRLFRQLRSDQGGAAGIMVAGGAFALVGAASLAVDVGSIYLAKRQLQGVADAAAIAAAGNVADDDAGFAEAQALIDHTADSGVTVRKVMPGVYARDPSIAPDHRFTPGWDGRSAVKVTVEQHVPLFFAKLLTGRDTTTISAEATAAQNDLAAYSLGTRLAAFSGGIPGAMLDALAGNSLGLVQADIATLQGASISALSLGDALRTRLGLPGAQYGSIYDAEIPLDTIVAAMADAAPDAASQTLLRDLATKVGTNPVKLSDIIDLGPLAPVDFNDGKTTAGLDAYTLLQASLELSNGPTYDVSFNTNVAGVAKTTVRVAGGPGVVHSPLLSITAAHGYVLRTSQSRIYISADINTGIPSLPTLHLPIYVELAASEAVMNNIQCKGVATASGVTLGVTPSIGSVAIGNIDLSKFDDFSQDMPVSKATLASALGISVTGYSDIALGGTSAQSVFFNRDEIAAHVTKTVATNDLIVSIASSLIDQMDLKVTTPLGAIGTSLLTQTVGQVLLLAGPGLDGLINNLLQALGTPLGLADTRIDQLRCGVPLLV